MTMNPLDSGAVISLQYPLAVEPGVGDGTAVEVASGVWWLRMPLEGALRFINVWAIAEGDAWTIVDTGMSTPQTLEAWDQAFKGVLQGKPVTRILVTHMHPDHCGVAGWLAERFNARLWMSRTEYLTCRLMAGDSGRKAPAAAIAFYRAAGWGQESIDHYESIFGRFGDMIHPLPASYRRLQDEERVSMGSHTWTVVMGNGHSPEHACLYCPALNLLISGDQVLPRISSNVSVYPLEPDANPLRDWLTSLERIKTRIPSDVLVLPAHNSPFLGLHARIEQLLGHHAKSLAMLREHLASPQRAVEVFKVLFKRPISPDLMTMATGEAVAHLNYLLARDEAARELDALGVWHWRRQ